MTFGQFLTELFRNYKMDQFTIASCVITCIVIFAIFKFIPKFGSLLHFYKQASRFPGPPTLPIIGNAHLFAGGAEAILDRCIQLSKLYPSPYRIWLGAHLLVVVNTPEQLKVVLLSPKTIDKGPFYDFVGPWLGTGLLTATGPKWRVHRKIMQPTFSPKILQSFIGIFAARSSMMAKEIERYLDGPEFDIYHYTSQCALHTICETAMGVNLGGQTDGNFCYADAVETVMAGLCKRVVSPWLHPNFIFHHTQLGRDQQKNIKSLHAFTDNVIQMKKKEILEHNRQPDTADNEEDTSNRIPRRKILLDHLIELAHNSETLSDEAIREEVDTIVAAGSDTTAAVSSYVLLMLAFHPEVQENLYRELCEIYGNEDSEELHFTPEDLTRMTYMECVIKETMRLFPIVPVLTRSVTSDLDIGEHSLPEGSLVLLSIIDLHRNGDYWPDPMKFDPDRFLPEEVEKRHPYAYLPFSGGPRSCLGSRYAMMSMKVLLATILMKYVSKKDTVTPVEDLRLKCEFMLRPVEPISLRIERRTRKVASI